MTNFNKYAPVSLGLETIFNRLDALHDSAATNYPPYNIIRTGEDTQELEIALSGFTREEIEVSTERNVLNVSTHKVGHKDDREYVHKGLAKRTFSRNWQLSDDTVVDGVTYVDGLLVIKLRKELPEAQRRRVLDIG
ncbi:hypothetical protein [Synechococcus phage S-B68]|nr:hypothetical protein [Synechococcus phage S-B68]